jgi:hypothetical protein
MVHCGLSPNYSAAVTRQMEQDLTKLIEDEHFIGNLIIRRTAILDRPVKLPIPNAFESFRDIISVPLVCKVLMTFSWR